MNLVALFNFYLKTLFNPRSDFYFVREGYSFLGRDLSNVSKWKALGLDVDGVLNRKKTPSLSQIILNDIANEYGKQKSLSEVIKYVKLLQTPDGMKIGEKKLSEIYTKEYDLDEETFNKVCYDSVKDFIKSNLITGALDFIKKSTEMGYYIILLSAAPRIALKFLVEELSLPIENFTGSYFPFINGKLRGHINFLVGNRRVQAKNEYLEKKIDTRYGCYVIIDDNPTLNAPTLKSGLNPAILVENFSNIELEKLDLDVYTCCPEARENLLYLLNPISKFEHAVIKWTVMGRNTIQNCFRLSMEQKEIYKKVFTRSDSKPDLNSLKYDFAHSALKIININGKFRLIKEESEIRRQIWELLFTADRIEEKIEAIYQYLKNNIPESHINKKILKEINII